MGAVAVTCASWEMAEGTPGLDDSDLGGGVRMS